MDFFDAPIIGWSTRLKGFIGARISFAYATKSRTRASCLAQEGFMAGFGRKQKRKYASYRVED